MKAVLALVAIAACIAVVYGDCDPDGNNKPICTGTSATRYRNFWDPTRYWMCSGTVAVETPCPEQKLYDPTTQECVMWNKWTWVDPCPASDSSDSSDSS